MSNFSRNKKSQQICRFQWCRILIYPKRIVVLNPKDGKISKTRAIELVQETCAFIEHFEGEIPGSSRIECGNYLDHSLPKAKQYAHNLAKTLAGWTEEKMVYQL